MSGSRKRKKVDRARLAAVKILYSVLEEGAFSNESAAFHLASGDLDARDRAFASALVFGSLTRLPRIDYDLARASSRPLEKLDPWVRTILRAGVWQLFYSYQVTTAAACDESVHLSRFLVGERVTGFVNGILRGLARQRPELEGPDAQAIDLGLPPELFSMFRTWYGPDQARALGAWFLKAPQSQTIRANALRMEAFLDWTQSEEGRSLSLLASPWPPGAYQLQVGGRDLVRTQGYLEGLFSLQSRAAILVGCLSGVKAGDRILDLCAAPGGKTGHLAELTRCEAPILACDVSESRVALLSAMARRLGHLCIESRVHDATREEASWKEAFELVLCDVPCSGLGLLHKRPEIRFRVTAASIDRLIGIQREILEKAATTVAPGGQLLYSTCTINPKENEDQISWFLKSPVGRSFDLVDLTGDLAGIMGDEASLPMSDRLAGTVALLPPREETDGFFIARLQKRP